MKFGLAIFPTEGTIPPAELGQVAEARGFESLFFPEHSHNPASRETPWPSGGDLPEQYWQTYDAFLSLAVVAQATTTLLVGTGVCLVIQRDPIWLAKEVATLDRLSGGRFLFGVGAGWNREEIRNHGTDPATRFSLFAERIEAMKAIWAPTPDASYHGKFVDFDRIWAWPKPLQQPHPPILMGGGGPKVVDRILAHGDGWFPNRRDPDWLRPRLEELRARAADAGRGPIEVTLFGARPTAADIEVYDQLGVHRSLFALPSAPRDEVLTRVDRLAELVATWG